MTRYRCTTEYGDAHTAADVLVYSFTADSFGMYVLCEHLIQNLVREDSLTTHRCQIKRSPAWGCGIL